MGILAQSFKLLHTRMRLNIIASWWYVLIALNVMVCLSGCHESLPVVSPPSAEDTTLLQLAQAYFQPLPVNTDTSLTSTEMARIELGSALFQDQKLSRNQTQSCNTCHDLTQYGVDNNALSKGDNGKFGKRNTPSIFNVSDHFAQFWDARVATLDEQLEGPLFGENEMNLPDSNFLMNRLRSHASYVELFSRAFPEEKKPMTFSNLKRAIVAFENQLTTPSRFDSFLKGDLNALDDLEKQGLRSFIELGCVPCHNGPQLGGNMVQKFAVFGYYWDYTQSDHLDEGRYRHTSELSDKFMFKVPSLRNVEMTYPYLHDGSIEDLSEAVHIMAKAELGFTLDDETADNIVSFLKTLTTPEEIMHEIVTSHSHNER